MKMAIFSIFAGLVLVGLVLGGAVWWMRPAPQSHGRWARTPYSHGVFAGEAQGDRTADRASRGQES